MSAPKNGRSLGRVAYERYSGQLGIVVQGIHVGSKRQEGAEAWEKLNDRARHFWETFAGGFATEVIALHKESTRRAEAERERKAMRADLFEREVRRRMAEIAATEKKE